ncbi:MAG: type CRISPR-associated endoribonuclease Cas2 [Parachlamydiales bacterium]|nr:type CRISPR-associated endoribonuclease Cas2 [Parachlamydiales bacterium]
MLVVVANDLPPAVRGRMKLWFIEPRPNVFVSGVKDSVAEKVIEYLHDHCPARRGLLIFRKTSTSLGYEIRAFGYTSRKLTELSCLQLVLEAIT